MKILSLHVCQNQNGRAPFADWLQNLDRASRLLSNNSMPLSIEFKEVFKASIDQDPAFGHELLASAVQSFLDNDLATGRAILRNHVNATIGFQQLARTIGGQEKSLMRMLSPNGSPLASNLFQVVHALQQFSEVQLEVTAVARKAVGRVKARS